jgi:putative SOS response-associated peptidase YedK
MCGRVVQASPPEDLSLRIVEGRGEPSGDRLSGSDRFRNTPPRYNGAPSQELWVIRQNPATGERSLDLLRWGLIPGAAAEKPKKPAINAAAEILTKRDDFAPAYARRRCIVPIDGFYEWRPVEGEKVKQPFCIAMRDGSPFGLAGLWENWKDPASGEWIRSFCIVTTRANALVKPIHYRMPAILKPADFRRWLGPEEDPRDLLGPFPPDDMVAWPVSTRVNSVRNDDASLVERHPEADGTWPRDGNSR